MLPYYWYGTSKGSFECKLRGSMMFCPSHENKEKLASRSIGHCGSCISKDSSLVDYALTVHQNIRIRDGLVPRVPAGGSIVCPDCGNHCRLEEGQIGFCHLRMAQGGQIIKRFSEKAMVSWYFDPLPTNCVADWVCPVTNNVELVFGRQRLNNLAVFYGSFIGVSIYSHFSGRQEIFDTAKTISSNESDPQIIVNKIAAWLKTNMNYDTSFSYF